MMKNKITRWLPFFTIVICGVLVAGVVVAQPGGGQGGGQGYGPGMGGPGQGGGPGMGGPGGGSGMGGPGPHMGGEMGMMLFGPGGPFADPEIGNLMAEVKILGFINRFDFTADQLKAISGLSNEARSVMGKFANQIRPKLLAKLNERRDAMMAGEKPDQMKPQEKPEGNEEMRQAEKDTMETMKGIADKFYNLLTDEQKQKLEKDGNPQFGPGPNPGNMGPGGWGGGGGQGGPPQGGWGGPQGSRSSNPGDETTEEPKFKSEDPSAANEEPTNPDENAPDYPKDRQHDKDRMQQGQWGPGGGQGGQGQGPGFAPGGPGGPMGPGGMGDPSMMRNKKIIEILLDPHTIDIINAWLHK